MKRTLLMLWLVLLTMYDTNAQSPAAMSKLTAENRSDQIEIVRGMPVILYYRIVSLLQTDRDQIMASLPDSLQTEPETIQRLDSIFAPLVLAPKGSGWVSGIVFHFDATGIKRFKPPVMQLITPIDQDIDAFDYGSPLFAYYGIDPEATRNIKPGKVKIKIGSVINQGMDTMWAKPVEVIFLDTKIKRNKQMSREQKLITARYRLRRGQCKEAEPLARELYQSDSASLAYIFLLADVEECAGRNGAALELLIGALMKMMENPSSKNNPPDLLMLRIMRLQEKVMTFE